MQVAAEDHHPTALEVAANHLSLPGQVLLVDVRRDDQGLVPGQVGRLERVAVEPLDPAGPLTTLRAASVHVQHGNGHICATTPR